MQVWGIKLHWSFNSMVFFLMRAMIEDLISYRTMLRDQLPNVPLPLAHEVLHQTQIKIFCMLEDNDISLRDGLEASQGNDSVYVANLEEVFHPDVMDFHVMKRDWLMFL